MLEVQGETRAVGAGEQRVRSPSHDVQTMMAFESNKKSTGVTYLLWFFLGGLGVHRFYLGRSGSGAAILILFVLGWLTVTFVVGALPLIAVGVWLLVDAFLIPGMVQSHNNLLARRLGGDLLAY